jgi:hypothetical protein
MKRRQMGLLLSVGILALYLPNGSARSDDAKSFTCKVHGGSFVLDDDDFKALASAGITREKFAALAPKDRVPVCDTRMVARLIKSGTADECTFDTYDYQVVVKYFDKSELSPGLKAAVKPHAGKCR